MQDENNIFGLIAHAEDIQKHAVALQRSVQDAINKIPETSKSAVRDAAKEFITEEAKKASVGLLDASNEAKATSVALRRTGLMQGVFLVAVVVVICCTGFGVMNFIINSKFQELAELKTAIRKEQITLNDLYSKTWGLELVKYQDGTRGILLPKGIKVDRTGKIKETGQEAIVIKP